MDLIFDRVCVDMPEGKECLPPEKFIQKPLHLRVQYIMEKKISFWLSNQEVEIKSALNNYRKWSALRGAMASTRL